MNQGASALFGADALFPPTGYDGSMGGQWSRAWRRDDLNDLRQGFLQVAGTRTRACELAELNLPPATHYFLVPFQDGSWGWFVGNGMEEHVTPVAKIPRRSRIYTPAGAECELRRMPRRVTRSSRGRSESRTATRQHEEPGGAAERPWGADGG